MNQLFVLVCRSKVCWGYNALVASLAARGGGVFRPSRSVSEMTIRVLRK